MKAETTTHTDEAVSREWTMRLLHLRNNLVEVLDPDAFLEIYGVWFITGETRWAKYWAGNTFARREMCEQYLGGLTVLWQAQRPGSSKAVLTIDRVIKQFVARVRGAAAADSFKLLVLVRIGNERLARHYTFGDVLTARGVVRHACAAQDAVTFGNIPTTLESTTDGGE